MLHADEMGEIEWFLAATRTFRNDSSFSVIALMKTNTFFPSKALRKVTKLQ